jgi:hypothetical protein
MVEGTMMRKTRTLSRTKVRGDDTDQVDCGQKRGTQSPDMSRPGRFSPGSKAGGKQILAKNRIEKHQVQETTVHLDMNSKGKKKRSVREHRFQGNY